MGFHKTKADVCFVLFLCSLSFLVQTSLLLHRMASHQDGRLSGWKSLIRVAFIRMVFRQLVFHGGHLS